MGDMQNIIDFIINNGQYAPWITFGIILLAGFNIPISIDVIIILSGVLAATTIPEQTLPLYFSILVGTYFSGWIAYGIGRFLGGRLLKLRWFAKIFHEKRLKKVSTFYNKHGFLALLFGRFIPFGIRNCIFMTAGMSDAHFGKFAIRDSIACSIWATTSFYTFFSIGQNYQLLMQKVKIINLIIFLAFSVTVISLVWYKKRKKQQFLQKIK